MARRLLAALVLLIVADRGLGLLLQRPERDCISPSLSKLNEFDFYPKQYRSVISAPEPAVQGTEVRRMLAHWALRSRLGGSRGGR